MHRQIAADAVAGAVVEVEAGSPKELPRQGVELGAGRAVRKHRTCDGDVALEHAGEALAHLCCRWADRDRAGHVGGAVLILRAGVDQKEFAGHDTPVGFLGNAVVHDGAVRPRARNGRERNVLEQAGVAPKTLQRRHRINLGEVSARSLPVEPRQEPRQGGAVARMRRARALDLDGILHRLHQRDRIAPARHLAAVARDQARERVGGGRLVETHDLAGLTERC